jgi:hypothetical protein
VADPRDKPRHQSQTERDIESYAAHRERVRSRPLGVPVAVPSFEDITNQYQGEDLERARAKRPTDKRIAHLEKKHDDLARVVGGLEKGVANIDGKLDVLPQLLELLKGKNADEHATKRHRMTSHEKVLAAAIAAIGAVITALIVSGSGCA